MEAQNSADFEDKHEETDDDGNPISVNEIKTNNDII